MDEALLTEFMLKQSETTGAIAKQVDDMHTRLFGNGQPGALQNLETAIAKTNGGMVETKEKLSARIDKIEGYRNGDKKWLAGAFAVIGTEGAALGFYFHYLAAKVQPLFDAMKAMTR